MPCPICAATMVWSVYLVKWTCPNIINHTHGGYTL